MCDGRGGPRRCVCACVCALLAGLAVFNGGEDWADVFLPPQEEQGGVLPASDFLSGDPMGAERRVTQRLGQ